MEEIYQIGKYIVEHPRGSFFVTLDTLGVCAAAYLFYDGWKIRKEIFDKIERNKIESSGELEQRLDNQ